MDKTIILRQGGTVRETLIKSARAVSERFFLRQKNGKQRNTFCISCFSFCMDGEKDKLFSRRRFIQRFLSMYFKPDELTKLLMSFNETFSSVSLLMDCYTKKAAKLSKYKNPINDVGVNLGKL